MARLRSSSPSRGTGPFRGAGRGGLQGTGKLSLGARRYKTVTACVENPAAQLAYNDVTDQPGVESKA